MASDVQILNSFLRPLRRLMLLLPHRHSSSKNIGANERLIPRRQRALQHWTPFRHRYLSFESLALCKDLGANEISNSATSRGPRIWTLARRITSTTMRMKSTRFRRTTHFRSHGCVALGIALMSSFSEEPGLFGDPEFLSLDNHI